jgi:hypothetical protein
MQNLDALKTKLQDYHARTGVIPAKGLLCHDLGLTLDELNAGLRELVKDGTLKEFAGTLRLAKQRPEKRVDVRQVLARLPKINVAAVVRVVLLAVSLVAMYISIGYSYTWVVQFLDPLKAVLLSASVVIYVTFAPEGAALMIRMKSISGTVLASLLVITAIAALIFSMAMTVIGQYNTMTDLIATQAETASAGAKSLSVLDVLRAQEKTAAAAVDGIQKEIEIQQKALAALTPGSPEAGAAGWKLSELQNRLYYARIPLDEARKQILTHIEKDDTITTDQVKRETFYDFAARETGIGRGVIEFILYLIPALFMDIIAPLGMFVALGSGKRKEKI